MKKVFISYAREDVDTARKLYNDLKQSGVVPWLDQENLLVGQKWKDEIRQVIQKSDYFIALFSSNSVSKRGFVQKELKIALDVLDEHPAPKRYILPIRLDECHPLDEKLQNLQWEDIFPSYEDGLKEILSFLKSDKQEIIKTGLGSSGKLHNKKNLTSKKNNKRPALLLILFALLVTYYFLNEFKLPFFWTKTYALTVDAEPADAVVKIINSRREYHPRIMLEPGKYYIEVSKQGYETERWSVELTDKDLIEPVTLKIITYALTVDAKPADAKVEIINPQRGYYAGIKLEPNLYQIRVSSSKYYKTKTLSIDIKDHVTESVELEIDPAPVNSVKLELSKHAQNYLNTLEWLIDLKMQHDADWKAYKLTAPRIAMLGGNPRPPKSLDYASLMSDLRKAASALSHSIRAFELIIREILSEYKPKADEMQIYHINKELGLSSIKDDAIIDSAVGLLPLAEGPLSAVFNIRYTGVRILSVTDGMQGKTAGLKEGDLIIDYNGVRITDSQKLVGETKKVPSDKTVRMIAVRDKKLIRFYLKGGLIGVEIKGVLIPEIDRYYSELEDKYPVSDMKHKYSPKQTGRLYVTFGIQVSDITPEIARRFNIEASETGAIVTNVESGSKAEKAGLLAGDIIKDINRKTVKKAEDYTETVRNVKPGESVNLFIRRLNSGLVIKIKNE